MKFPSTRPPTLSQFIDCASSSGPMTPTQRKMLAALLRNARSQRPRIILATTSRRGKRDLMARILGKKGEAVHG